MFPQFVVHLAFKSDHQCAKSFELMKTTKSKFKNPFMLAMLSYEHGESYENGESYERPPPRHNDREIYLL